MNQLSKALPASELPSLKRIKSLLLGPTGSGKTSMALTAPGPMLIVDTDHRLSGSLPPDTSILQYPPDTKNPGTPWKNLVALMNELWELANKDSLPYETIVFDGLSTLSSLAIDWALELTGSAGQKIKTSPGGGPAQAHYGPQIHQLTKFISRAVPLPCHIIFTGHIDLYEDEHTGKLRYCPTLYGKTARSTVPSLFNETYECFRKKETEGMKFYLNTVGDSNRMDFLKSSFNKPVGSLWQDPLHVDLGSSTPGFQHILSLAEGRR
jgi:hypothetical protein